MQGVGRILYPLSLTRGIAEAVALHEPGHRFEHRQRFRWSVSIEKAFCPGIDLMRGIGIVAFGRTREVRRVIGRIAEWIGSGIFLDRTIWFAAFKMFDLYFALIFNSDAG